MRCIKRIVTFLIGIALVLAIASPPAAAVLTNIQKGETVFLGEQGLVLAGNVFYSSGGVTDDQLAYFAGANPVTDSPEYVLTPTKTSFFVSPATFSDRTGQWHSYPNGSKNGHVAINVIRPSLDLRLWAFRPGGASFDLTNGKIVKGEALDFRIDSNLYPIFQRTGVSAGDDGVDIKVQNQVGATLTALYDCTGAAVSIVNVHPDEQQFFLPAGAVACVWDTGNDHYRTGSYTIWAECNVNGMKDNLGSIQGQTVTPSLSSLKSTPTPTTAAATASPTEAPTKKPTAKPTKKPEVTPTTSTPVQTQAAQTALVAVSPTPTVTASSGPAELPQTGLSPGLIVVSVLFASAVAIAAKKK